MSRMNLTDVTLEVAERSNDFCECGSVPHPKYEPYCLHCGMYWEDVDAGLFDEHEELWEARN